MDILDKAKEMERKGIDVIHLEVGEPDFDVSENVSRSAIQAYAEHRTHYTSSLGDIELRKEIALL